jgi:multicomponent Na+:H+ antiporter subunit C
MVEFLRGHLDYWFTILLLMIGFYGMVMKKNLVKKLIGMSIFQTSIVLFYIAATVNDQATVPIKLDEAAGNQAVHYLNPLPHTLMLTAIVVGVAALGVGFALLSMIHRQFKTLEEDEILDQNS